MVVNNSNELKGQKEISLIVRFIGYSLSSLIALFISFLTQIDNLSDIASWVPLIFGIWGTSVPFFAAYSSAYYKKEKIDQTKEASAASIIISILIVIIGLLSYKNNSQYFMHFFIILGFNISMCWLYFIFYNSSASRDSEKLLFARYELVIPVLLSIGMCLTLGVYTRDVLDNGISLKILCLAPWLLYLVMSLLNIKKKWYFILSLFFLCVILITLVISYISNIFMFIRNELSLMLFSIGLSSILCVYEAWKVTARHFANDHNKGIKYYNSTSMAMVISILFMPLIFIFFDLGWFFVVSYSIILVATSLFWLYKGLNWEGFKMTKWIRKKTVIGYLLMLCLIIDYLIKFFLSAYHLPMLIPLDPVTIILSSVVLLITVITSKKLLVFRSDDDPTPNNLFVVSSWLFVGTIVSIIIVSILNIFSENQVKNNTSFSFLIYILILVTNLIWITVINSRKKYGSSTKIDSDNNSSHPGNIVSYVKLCRLFTSIVIMLIVFLPTQKIYGVGVALIKSLPFLLISMYAFCLNDLNDIEKDKINKPHRPLAKGALSPLSVQLFIVLLSVCVTISIIIATPTLTELILYLSTFAGVSLYNIILKKLSLIKTFITACITTLPFIFVLYTCQYDSIFYLLPVAVMFFINGREIFMDILDIQGDKKSGLKTIPINMTKKFALIFAISSQVIGVIFIILLVTLHMKLIYLFLCLFLIVSMILCYRLWFSQKRELQSICIKLLWLPMLSGFFILLC
ncbi:MAG: UbiA family prenyltransferase [Eubacteriales bacterium]|nr:UbiA family prenyltransferase [Eubacteriales bacterium]